MIPETILLQKPVQKQKYPLKPCPVCQKTKCYEHCNNCGKSIYFKRDEKGRVWIYESGTDTVHYNPETRKGCMNSGSKSGDYVKDGQVIKSGKPIVNEKNRQELYGKLSTREKQQVTNGRYEYQRLFYNDEFYRSRHIESKIY